MKRLILLLSIVGLLTACQPEQRVLPTAINIDAIGTESALTATANAPSPTATRRSLPPTFTPTPPDEVTAPAETPTAFVSATPEGYSGLGTIFYLYNGDSIAAVNGDGTNNNIIVTFGVGIPITDLTLSPDGLLLAFVAPGSGAAREVYVSNRDGTYLQKVTCLGMGDVRYLAWMPDNKQIGFFAAPASGAPGDIYIASYVGANTCPDGNNQHIVVPFQSSDIRGITFNRQGSILYYAGGGDQGLFAWDLITGDRKQVAYGSGFGGNFNPLGSPVRDTLVYLRYTQKQDGQTGGELVTVTGTDRMPDSIINPAGAFLAAKSMQWNTTGSVLTLPTERGVYVFDYLTGDFALMNDQILVSPDAAARPDGREIAYTTLDGNSVEQIFVYNRETKESRQLTGNPEGAIFGMVWAADTNIP